MPGIPKGTISIHEARNLVFQLMTGTRIADALDEIPRTESNDVDPNFASLAEISAETARSDVILEQLWTQGVLEVFAQNHLGVTERLPREQLELCQGIRLASRVSARFPSASQLRKYDGSTLFLKSADLKRTLEELGIGKAKKKHTKSNSKRPTSAAKRGRRAIYDWPSVEIALLRTLARRGVPHADHSMKWKSVADVMRWVQEWCGENWGKEPGNGVTRKFVLKTLSKFIKSQPKA